MEGRGPLNNLLQSIEPVDPRWIERAEARQCQLTKPPGSLGRLEELANRCAAIQQTLTPQIRRPTILVFAGDHGVCSEGVSTYPQEVTAQMVTNFLRGGAAINALARTGDIRLEVVDVGVANAIPEVRGLIRRRLAAGTRNFCREPAMTKNEAIAALDVGIELANHAVDAGCTLMGIGEMGIGNTTAASAVVAALAGLPAETVVGRGTGADDACMNRKIGAVKRALDLHLRHIQEPLDLLSRLSGFEIAAMCGCCLAAAARKCALVVDGFIATASAAVALQWHPSVKDYLFLSHRSTEPGHSRLLEMIGQRPLLNLDMRLGEGTGGALAIGIIRAAVAAFTEMATFESAGVSDSAGPKPGP